MSTVDFSLDDIRLMVREEVGSAKDELNEKIDITRHELHEKLDSTRQELREKLDATRFELSEKVDLARFESKSDIKRVQSMLEEDYEAEVDRVTRIEKSVAKTRADLRQHIADTSVHTGR